MIRIISFLLLALLFVQTINGQCIVANTPSANAALGQASLTSNTAGTTQVAMQNPSAVTFSPLSFKIFVTESGNSRVLRFPANPTAFGANAEFVFGQSFFTTSTPGCNIQLMNFPTKAVITATDNMWVADAGNNRVLLFTSVSTAASTFAPLSQLVLGQTSFLLNGFGTNQQQLSFPQGVTVDVTGSLYIADSGNNRVLRYDNAASITQNGALATAVLGQGSFTTGAAATAATGMSNPADLTIDSSGNLYVADTGNNRVLRFNSVKTKPNGGSADAVLGQASFTTAGPSNAATGLNQPFSIGLDNNNRLLVGDFNNNRMFIYAGASTFTSGASASLVVGQTSLTANASASCTASTLAGPGGMFFDSAQNAVYLADYNNNRVVAYCFQSITPSSSLTASGSASISASGSLTATVSLTASGSISVSPSVTWTSTPSWTVSPSVTWTSTPSWSSSLSPSNTLSPTSTRTSKPTKSATRPASASQTFLAPPPTSPMSQSNTLIPAASSQAVQPSTPVQPSIGVSQSVAASSIPNFGTSFPVPSASSTTDALGCREGCQRAFLACKRSGHAARSCRLARQQCVAKCGRVNPSPSHLR